MKRAVVIGILDILILIFLLPSYKEIIEDLQDVVESVIGTPLTDFEAFVFASLPIVFVVATLFWFGWRIFRSREGGVRF